MKTVKKNVYYCDYCNKRSLGAAQMVKHEKHCTMNPHRTCRMCKRDGESLEKIVESFKVKFIIEQYTDEPIFDESPLRLERVVWTGDPVTIEDVRDAVDGCPTCLLAVMRQCGFNRYYFEEVGFGKFDYQKENRDWWNEMNRDNEDDY